MAKSLRFNWVDIAKGIATLLVVYRHVLIGVKRSGIEIVPFLLQLNEMVYSFRMPLFFILSGFFFAKSVEKRSKKEFSILKVRSLIYPYLVWALIQVTLQIILNDYTNSDRTIKHYAYILLIPRAIDQLWFLFALFNTTMFYFFLKYIVKIGKGALFVICIASFYASSFIKEYSLIHDLLFFMPFFMTGDFMSGKMMSQKFQKQLSSLPGVIILLPIFLVTQWYWLNHPEINIFAFGLIAIFGSFFTLAISLIIAPYKISNFFNTVGKNSLQIYVMHVLVSSAFRMLFSKVFGIDNTYILLLVGLSFGVMIPLYVVRLSKRFPILNRLFSPP